MGSRSVAFLAWMRGVATAVILSVVPAVASAQYFGENKVQYRTQQFHVLHTDHFDIYFHQDDRTAVDMAGRMAERWWRRLSPFFGRELTGRQVIVLYSSRADFEQTSIVSDLIDAGTGGLTEPWRRRIALPFASSLADTDHVLGHEIVHAFQMDLIGGTSLTQGSGDSEPLPLWMIEGLAEFLTLGPVDAHTAMWLRDAAQNGRLPSRLEDLDRPEYFPYRWGHAFWAHVASRGGNNSILRLFETASFLGIASAVEGVLGETADQFMQGWLTAIRASYAATTPPVGTHVVGAQAVGGSINVGAAISPDGRWIACLAERVFAIDLVVVDAQTGKVAKVLTDMAVNRRYSSLPFVASNAAWNRQGTRLAIGTLTSGRAAISVFSWPRGVVEKDIRIDGVDEIIGPTWSPDGQSVAFSGMSAGLTDLFVYDLERGTLRRLTTDAFADLQPAWSPDGTRIAFVSDRFTTDLDTLTPGPFRLATIDVATGEIGPISAFESGKHIAPQWSPDGQSIYFVSDNDGISNLYAIELRSGATVRLTASSGVSGLTASSPALSVAAQTGMAAMSVYERGGFAIHTFTMTSGLPEAPSDAIDLTTAAASVHAAGPLAPDNPTRASAPDSWHVSKYRPRLSLEGVSQASLTAGLDPFGPAAGGGIGLTFTDMLNTHWLVGAAQLASPLSSGFSLGDIAGYGGYFNRVRRWHWGMAGQLVPSYVGVALDTPGQNLPPELTPFVVVRQTERVVRAIGSYAFSRARRIEMHGSRSRLTFDELADLGFGAAGWRPAAAPLSLTSVATAFVSDTSHAGPTSAVRGERYRLEAASVSGSLNYMNLVADYRRYLMPVSFYTIAVRALHVGRYGSGANDARLPPFYLGYPWLVRGYDLGWHVANDCVTILSNGCPELEGLLGSRLAVGNVELRFPLLRPFGLSPGMYGPIPVEVALFVDGGVAWRDRLDLSRTGGAWSTGVSLRTNLLGFGLGQMDIVRPVRNTPAGWTVQFTLAPAF